MTTTTNYAIPAVDEFGEHSGLKMGRVNPIYSGKWNWGAFFWQWLYVANMRRGWLALGLFVLSLIPFVNLGVAIYLGIKGNDIAYDGRKFINLEQFVAVQNAWRNWGFWLVGISFVLFIVDAAIRGH